MSTIKLPPYLPVIPGIKFKNKLGDVRVGYDPCVWLAKTADGKKVVVRFSNANPNNSAIDLLKHAAMVSSIHADYSNRTGEKCNSIVEILNANLLPQGTAYVVMPYYGVKTLASNMPLTMTGVVNTVANMADILGAVVHKAGFIHRDAKPDNWVIAKANLRLIDFQFSGLKSEKDHPGGVSIGSRGYMSAQQYLGEYDARADVFCLAVDLSQLLARDVNYFPFNEPPAFWSDKKWYAHMAKTLEETTANVQLSRLFAGTRSDVIGELSEIVKRNTSYDPDKRDSLAQFAKNLRAIVS